jgi:adenine-specific DNA-methyltransferase
MAKTKLELTWIGKENRPKLEPRILLEDTSKSYHAPHRVTANDIFDNRLIFGDNLLALRALEQEFTGRIKCVYIDPPFNTGEMFEHYDDGVEHSVWLTQMRDRLEILHHLLAEDGSLFIHIDDNELGYLIAVADEIFGRNNRISVVTFKQSSVSGPKAVNPGLVSTASYILYYVKNKASWKPNRVFMPTERDDRYNRFIENPDDDFSLWTLLPLKEAFATRHKLKSKDLKKHFGDELEELLTEFVLEDPRRVVRTARVAPKDINPSARDALAQSGKHPGKIFRSEREDKDDYFFLDGEQLIFYAAKAIEIDGKWITALPASTIWDDLLSNNLHKEGDVEFPNGKKPEGLLKRILTLATNPNEWVLDSFAGSGTTGAVAHKMGRKWIMVELRDHCLTHVIPRIRKVIDGTDDSGVTAPTNWKGGGGFRFYRLAPSLLEKDSFGNWVISKEFNPAMLAEAICKLEGFLFSPSESVYWQHGHATESDYIYVTTQTLGREQLAQLSEQVGDNRSLLVMCSAFRARSLDGFTNLTIKKIPKTVLTQCEWGKDDYSLQIKNLPSTAEPSTDTPSLPNNRASRKAKARRQDSPTLFD